MREASIEANAHGDVEHPEGRHVLRRVEFDLARVNARLHGCYRHRGEVSIQALKRPVATTNEAASTENLRLIDASC